MEELKGSGRLLLDMDDFPSQPPDIRPVGLFTRILAWMSDSFLFGLAMIPVVLLTTLPLGQTATVSEDIGTELWELAIALAQSFVGFSIQFPIYSYFYYISGQTPGKRLFRIRIVDSMTLEPLSAPQAAGRYLGTVLSSCCCYSGYMLAALNRERRALHDYIAGTRVAYTERVPWTTGEVVLTVCLCAMAGIGFLLFPFILLAYMQEALEAMENPLWYL